MFAWVREEGEEKTRRLLCCSTTLAPFSPRYGEEERMRSTCEHVGCTKEAACGFTEKLPPRFCAEHKKDGMVDVINTTCARRGCTTFPVFGVAGSKKREFCSEHKKDGMVDVINMRCAHHGGCTIVPSYCVAGSKKREFCSRHKKDGMVNVVDARTNRFAHPSKRNRCAHRFCAIVPSYCVSGSKKGRFCSQHKKDGMVNVVDARTNRCVHPGCSKRPSYGVVGSKKAEFCYQHKKDGMLDFSSKIQASGDDTSGGSGLGCGNSGAADADETTLHIAYAKRRRACPPSSTQAQYSSGNHSAGDQRTRHAPDELPVSSTSVEPTGDESATPVEPGNAAKVKTEPGLFEGRPSGSFHSRWRHRSGGRDERTAPGASAFGGAFLAPHAPEHQPE